MAGWIAALAAVALFVDAQPGSGIANLEWVLKAKDADFAGGPAELKLKKGQPGPTFIIAEGGKHKGPCQPEPEDPENRWSTIAPALSAHASMKFKLWPVRMLPPKTVQMKQTEAGLEVSVRGRQFTIYRVAAADGPKPYFWPVIGPTGKPVTRAFPMKQDVPGEARDHVHHRSWWFTHGKVGGSDFWSELPRAGKQVHREFVRIVEGPVFGEFVARTDWMSREGKKVCEDTRRFRVWATEPYQLVDFEIVMKATEGELLIGDDKEGTFGFRVATSMDVKQKDKSAPHGKILNSAGLTDSAAWGKRAAWVDYSGPVDGKTVGIAIFDSPRNYCHPTHWHVRDYGLFAANPFGHSYFEPKSEGKKPDGSVKIPAGGELRLAYRVYIHEGDADAARPGAHFAAFAAPPVFEPAP